jgi:Protein of unknown function (DUF3102)
MLEHTALIEAAKTAVMHAIHCGEPLIPAKSQVQHGQWGEWLEANLPDLYSVFAGAIPLNVSFCNPAVVCMM